MGIESIGGGRPPSPTRYGDDHREPIRTETDRRSPDQIDRSNAAAAPRRPTTSPDARAGTHRASGQTPATATPSQAAVESIRARPLPRSDDLQSLAGSVGGAVFTSRVETFNDGRAQEARDALDRLAPSRDDYSGLNPATARAEYNDALATFNADPYVRELRRIESEASTARSSLPSYLVDSQRTVDARAMPEGDLRASLGALGVTLPSRPTTAQLEAGRELLGSIPQDLIGPMINQGMQVTFTTPVAGVGTPSILPARAGAGLIVEGETRLTDPVVGPGFAETQVLEMSLELRGQTNVSAGGTTQRTIYRWATRLEELVAGSSEIRDMVQSSPLLRNAVRGFPISFDYASYSGTRLSYEAVVTPQMGERIADGDLGAAPNPLDPLSMPAGTSLLLRGQNLVGSEFEAGYKLLNVSGSHNELEGMGFGVRRGEGDIVEIVSGPVSTIENDFMLGLGRGPVRAGVGADRSFESRDLRVAQLDLSTDEGQAAYQAFISSGRIPSWNPPGVLASGEQTVVDIEHVAYAGIELGPLSARLEGPSSQYEVVETSWQDGRVEQTTTYRLGDVTSEVSFPRDSGGRPLSDQTTWRLMVPNTHPALASYLNDAFSAGDASVQYDGEQHVQYTFTSRELLELRDQARASVKSLVDQGGVENGEDYLAALDAGRISVLPGDRTLDIARAKTAEEVFLALESHPDFVPEDLLALSLDTQQPVPGRLEVRDADQ